MLYKWSHLTMVALLLLEFVAWSNYSEVSSDLLCRKLFGISRQKVSNGQFWSCINFAHITLGFRERE